MVKKSYINKKMEGYKMSVNEERMFILKMLEEGKITSEEAAKLISAMDTQEKPEDTDSESKNSKEDKTKNKHSYGYQYNYQYNPNGSSFQEEISKMRDKIHGWKKEFKNNYNQKDFDKMVDDFSGKAEEFGKNLASSTAGVVDKVIDFVGSFVDTNAFNIFGSYNTVEKSFEAAAIEGMNIEVQGCNGNINIRKSTDDKIVLLAKIKSPATNTDNVIKFINNETGISAGLENAMNISVSWDILVPPKKFGNFKLETANGKINVEDTISSSMEAITKNAHIELMGVNSDSLKISTKNAKVQMTYVAGKEIVVDTRNAFVDMKHVKANKLKVNTANGRISIEDVHAAEAEVVEIDVKTANGMIKINMNDTEETGYKVDAKTTNGSVNLLIPSVLYSNVAGQGMGNSNVQAETKDFEASLKKVYIKAETSNGYIEIMK